VVQRVERAGDGVERAWPLGAFEFVYRGSASCLRWQTAKGDTKADAKAGRAEMVTRLRRGARGER